METVYHNKIYKPGSSSSSMITSQDMAIGAASESASSHITTIITLAIRLDVWALQQRLQI